MELITVWDGSRDGYNRGLLMLDADTPTPPPPTQMEAAYAPDELSAVQQALTDDWQSVRTLSEALTLRPDSVRGVLGVLMRRGEAERTDQIVGRAKRVVYRRPYALRG